MFEALSYRFLTLKISIRHRPFPRCGAACVDYGYVYTTNIGTGRNHVNPVPLEWFIQNDVFYFYPGRRCHEIAFFFDPVILSF